MPGAEDWKLACTYSTTYRPRGCGKSFILGLGAIQSLAHLRLSPLACWRLASVLLLCDLVSSFRCRNFIHWWKLVDLSCFVDPAWSSCALCALCAVQLSRELGHYWELKSLASIFEWYENICAPFWRSCANGNHPSLPSRWKVKLCPTSPPLWGRERSWLEALWLNCWAFKLLPSWLEFSGRHCNNSMWNSVRGCSAPLCKMDNAGQNLQIIVSLHCYSVAH